MQNTAGVSLGKSEKFSLAASEVADWQYTHSEQGRRALFPLQIPQHPPAEQLGDFQSSNRQSYQERSDQGRNEKTTCGPQICHAPKNQGCDHQYVYRLLVRS
jgi:hypothetical protein